MKTVKKVLSLILALFMVMSLAATASLAADKSAVTATAASDTIYLTGEGWFDWNARAINDMFDLYGKNSENYDETCRPYCVFDFDNSTAIMDVEEQLIIYQLEHLYFAVDPEKFHEVLLTGIPKENLYDEIGTGYVANGGTYVDLADDIAAAYSVLYDAGYVSMTLKTDAEKNEYQALDAYKEFAAKARAMYDVIGDNMSASISYPWITYWFTGMTPEEVFNLATECFTYYMGKSAADESFWRKVAWTSPADYKSRTGVCKISWNQGIGISDEIKEMYAALDANGFDVYLCSASYLDVIRAIAEQPELFGLYGIDGVVAMTNKLGEDGRYINEYDYDLHAQTQGVGKSETIDKVLLPQYDGRGPIFVVSDSQGDFNFCTEYADTILCLNVNRQRKDDAGLYSVVAVWQYEKGIDLVTAVEMGDILYLLQGRNENGGYFWSRQETQLLGKNEPALFSAKAEEWYKSFVTNNEYASVKAFIDNCVNLTGKLKTYVGYKARFTPNTCEDVSYDNWFYDAVAYVYNNKLFNGTSRSAFSPDEAMTRAMLVTVLYRIDGAPEATIANIFEDVANDTWYTDAIIWITGNGILNDYGNGYFGPNDSVTHEQMVEILYRYASYKGCDITAAADLSDYTDVSEISSWALTPMKWAKAEGLITNRTTATLVPRGNITRAEAAAILMRFCENVVR